MSARPPIDPQRWQPPGADFPVPEPTAISVTTMPLPHSGEDVAVFPDGTTFTGLGNGEVVRVSDDGEVARVATVSDGRILGLEVHPDGWLVACVADEGLFRVDPDTATVEAIQTEVEGRPLVFTNNAHVLGDGTILFSESTTRFGFEWYRGDFVEHSRTGSLWARSADGSVDRLLGGLAFANGVVKTPGEDSVLVAETGGYSIRKVWTGGEHAGESEFFVDGFPGMFDNLSVGPTGTVWAAIVNERNPALDFLLPRAPFLRKLAWATPEQLQPQPAAICRIVGFDATGAVTHYLEAPGRQYAFVTGVREHEGRLWLASIEQPSLAVVDLP